MTGFTLLYGCIYLCFGIWIYQILEIDWPLWIALIGSLICTFALHFLLIFVGHVSVLLHKKKQSKADID